MPTPAGCEAVVEKAGTTGVMFAGRTIASSALSPQAVGPAGWL
jgi:hypothetical protein